MSYEQEHDQNLIFEEPDLSGEYTARDYLRWRFEGYVELIRGKIFKMSPAPRDVHQALNLALSSFFYYAMKGHPCTVRAAPYDVYLVKDGQDYRDTRNIVQPDVAIICDQTKVQPHGCVGSPDFIIEILSPSTRKKDLTSKMELYEEYGVQEYWAISIPERLFIVNLLDESGRYSGQRTFTEGAAVAPGAFPNLKINLTEIFDEAEG